MCGGNGGNMVQWNFLMHLVNQTADIRGLNLTTSDQLISFSTICKNLEETWERCTCDPDRDGKLTYLRESLSKDKLEESHEPEDSQPLHHVQVSFPECDENIHCEHHENTDETTQIMPEDQDVSNDLRGDTTLEVIIEDQQQDLETAETINSEECEDMDPGLSVSQDNGLPSKITMDNTHIQETVNSENECFVEPPEKKEKSSCIVQTGKVSQRQQRSWK